MEVKVETENYMEIGGFFSWFTINNWF